MTKINNKGFVLAEMLIVTVFLMVIFSILYSNFYPLLAEYEIREEYDDVDSKYEVYWIKKMIEDSTYTENLSVLTPSDPSVASEPTFIRFNCNKVSTENEKQATCKALVKSLEVANCDDDGNNCQIYITNYQLERFKNTLKEDDTDTFTTEFKSYIKTLPDFKTPSLNNAKYRVIAVFNHTMENGETYASYATIEVRK